MSELKLINPKSYLDKKLRYEQEVSESDVRESQERIRKPIADIEYQDIGKAEIETKEYKVQFSYSQVGIDDEQDIKYYIEKKRDNIEKEEINKFTDVKNWRKLDSLIIKPNNLEKKINVFDAIPKKYSVFFYPRESFGTGSCFYEQNKIYLIGGIESVMAIATLLHEAGHAWDFSNLEKLGVEKLIDNGKHSNDAERLRKERAASAFALKVMRPFLSKELKRDVINDLKHYALETYEENIKSRLATHTSMAHFARDYEYDEEAEDRARWMWDQWLEFKETDEYEKWKQLEEFKNLDEYEEYGAWYEWIEEQWEKEKEEQPEY